MKLFRVNYSRPKKFPAEHVFEAASEKDVRVFLKRRRWRILQLSLSSPETVAADNDGKTEKLLIYNYPAIHQLIAGSILGLFGIVFLRGYFGHISVLSSLISAILTSAGISVFCFRSDLCVDFNAKELTVSHYVFFWRVRAKTANYQLFSKLSAQHYWREEEGVVQSLILRLIDPKGHIFEVEKSDDVQKTLESARILADRLQLPLVEEGPVTVEQQKLKAKEDAARTFWDFISKIGKR